MENKKTIAFHTLGCKLNYSETSAIARTFDTKLYSEVNFKEAADVYVINTCSVTDNADKECRQLVRGVLQKSPNALVAIIGCYAQLKPNEIASIEGVDIVLGANEKFKLANYINALTKQEKAQVHACEINDVTSFSDAFSLGNRTRTFLKVQDGCDYTCSYCTIPLARGASRSDTIINVVANANKIATQGVKEIVLTGVNIGDFGLHIANGETNRENNFFDLIKELDKVEGIERFRISSIEPNLLKDEIIEFVAQSNKFVPHFHIPLQSGSNTILKLMRRRYMRELYTERVAKIKSLMPHCSIGVDVIVGFPGETEELFNETYNFINGLDISYLHVFTYSERDNTDAIDLPNTVQMAERKKRNNMLRILSAKKQYAFYSQQLATTKNILFEHENKDGQMFGFTDNYIKVSTPFNPILSNTIVSAKLSEINADGNVIINLDSITENVKQENALVIKN